MEPCQVRGELEEILAEEDGEAPGSGSVRPTPKEEAECEGKGGGVPLRSLCFCLFGPQPTHLSKTLDHGWLFLHSLNPPLPPRPSLQGFCDSRDGRTGFI